MIVNKMTRSRAVRASILFFMFLVPDLLSAAESEAIAIPEFSWSGYIRAIVLMGLILFGLWGGLYFLRRFGRFGFAPHNTITRDSLYVEGQLTLAPRKGLIVVRFLNKRLLLGLTEKEISLITQVDICESAEGQVQTRHKNAENDQLAEISATKANGEGANDLSRFSDFLNVEKKA